MKTACCDIIVNRLIISGSNKLHPEAVEVFLLGFIVAMISLASQEFTNRNTTISTDGYRKRIDPITGTSVKVFETSSRARNTVMSLGCSRLSRRLKPDLSIIFIP